MCCSWGVNVLNQTISLTNQISIYVLGNLDKREKERERVRDTRFKG